MWMWLMDLFSAFKKNKKQAEKRNDSSSVFFFHLRPLYFMLQRCFSLCQSESDIAHQLSREIRADRALSYQMDGGNTHRNSIKHLLHQLINVDSVKPTASSPNTGTWLQREHESEEREKRLCFSRGWEYKPRKTTRAASAVFVGYDITMPTSEGFPNSRFGL